VPFRTPTMTTKRLPALTAVVGVTAILAAVAECAPACWTNAGTKGVTAFEAADAVPVPLALMAVTLKV